MNIKIATILVLITLISNTGFSQKKKAIVIGIDGLQYEQIANVSTPNIDQFYTKKGYTGGIYGTVSEQVTSSGPSWISILTGVWTDQHGIVNNAGEKLSKVPSIFSYVREHNKDAYITSISTWKQINLLLKQDMYKMNFATVGGSDSLSTELIVDQINDYAPDFSFVHLDDIDHVGHAYGFGTKYTASIEHIDFLIGDILKAVEKRENENQEDWLVIIVTDHGRDAKGFSHGAQKINQKTIFIGMNKEGNSFFKNSDNYKKINSLKDIETLIPQTAVVPTVLKHLGIPINPDWNLDAKSLIE